MVAAWIENRYEVVDSGCWEWLLRRDKRGYGRVTHRGKTGQLAHRVVYEALVGTVPIGMTLDHICFNPPCVNPEHMRVSTRRENAARQRTALATHCSKGHEFTPENTYIKPAGSRGQRQCRECNKIAVRDYRKRSAA